MTYETMQKTLIDGNFRKVRGSRVGKIARLTVIYTVMTVFAAIFLIPYIYMLLRALMQSSQVQLIPIELWPRPFTFEAFGQLFGSGGGYLDALWQTMKIVLFNLIAIPLSASFVAYGFSKTKFAGKRVLFAVMLGTMMLPGAVVQIPLYVMFSKNGFNWLDTVLPLTIPNLFGGGAIYIFLIRQYMTTIPYELEEAARLDGANPFMRYFRITLPLCVPVLIFIMITVFNANWSDFYGPLVYMTDGTETLAYRVFKDAIYTYVTPDKANLKMAGGLFMSFFPTLLFIIFQKQLIEGVSTSALKG